MEGVYDDTPPSWATLNSLTSTQSPFVSSQTSVTAVTRFSPSGRSTAPSACASAHLGQTPLANNQSVVRLCKNCRRGGVFSLCLLKRKMVSILTSMFDIYAQRQYWDLHEDQPPQHDWQHSQREVKHERWGPVAAHTCFLSLCLCSG